MEDLFHALTFDLFHEQVSRSISRSNGTLLDDSDQGIPGAQANKFTNPLAALSAAFLEPVMNVFNVYLLTVRSIFNIVHWRDPYLSFWFLVLLSVLVVTLALFPWKSFFFLSGLLCFGPQNYFLRNNMFIRRELFGLDDLDKKYDEDGSAAAIHASRAKLKFEMRRKTNNISSANKRKLFSTQHGMKQAKKKNISPLEIVVPYARSRRERFYFWPPLSLLIQKEQEAAIDDSEVSEMKKSL